MNAQAPSHRATVLTLVTAALLLISISAHAAFLTPDANWTLSYEGAAPASYNGGASGAATFNNGYDQDTSTSLAIVGPNNLSFSGASRMLVTSRPLWQEALTGPFVFDWTKNTADNRGSAQDQFGYFIIRNGVTTYSPLGDNVSTPNFGTTTVSGLLPNDRFGFFVYSKDNDKGALTFTITSFSGPLSAVPEASAYLTLAFAGLIVAGIARRRKAAR
jgi:hypothetical protein